MKTSFSRYAPVAQLESEHRISTPSVGSSSLSWGAKLNMRPGRLRIGKSERLEYTRLAQWREHLATNQGFVGVRVPHRVPFK